MKRSLESIPYLDIFKRAWEITWKNRFLWWFGLFISLTGGSGLRLPNWSDKKPSPISQDKIAEFFLANLYWIIPLALFLLVILIVLIILSLIGRGALIKSIQKITQSEPADFGAGFREGRKYMGKIFLVNLCIGLLILSFVVVGIIPSIFLLASKAIAAGVVLLILTILVLIPLAITASLSGGYAHIYVVSGELNVWDAIENGYNLFRNNVWPSIIMALLFIPVNMAVFFAIILLVIPLVLVFGLLAGGLYLLAGKIAAIIAIAIGILFFFLAAIGIGAVYQTFSQVAWFLFFQEIAKPKVEQEVREEVPVEAPKVLPATDAVKTLKKE